jgi:hypothetical protein
MSRVAEGHQVRERLVTRDTRAELKASNCTLKIVVDKRASPECQAELIFEWWKVCYTIYALNHY